jgi:hypothetical protein
MTHDEIVTAAIGAVKKLSRDFPVSKAQIFWHILENYPALTAEVLRGINAAWEHPDFEHIDLKSGDEIVKGDMVTVRECDDKQVVAVEPPNREIGIHLVKRVV